MANNAIVLAPAADVNVDDMYRVGKMLALSGYFDARGNGEQAIAQVCTKILAGREMGYGPFASVQGIHIIQGKPSVSANLMAAAVKASGRYDYRVRSMGDDAVAVEFFEVENGKRESLGVSTFTMKEATAAGLTSNPTWKKFPRNMMFARALSNGVRWYCPDVFNGNAVYVPEELGASVDGDGNVIDVDYRQVDKATGEVLSTTTPEATSQPAPQPAPQPEQKATPAPAPKASAKPEKESTPHTRFFGQGVSTFGPAWDTVRPMIAAYVAHSDTSNDISDANKDALYAEWKANSRQWQAWARNGMDAAQLVVLMPETVEVQDAAVPDNLFETTQETAF